MNTLKTAAQHNAGQVGHGQFMTAKAELTQWSDGAKLELPVYAFPYAHPAAGRHDVGAEFRGDDDGSICVSIERTEGGQLALQLGRSGLGENCFSCAELARVLELAGILFAANGKQPMRAGA